MPTTERQTYLDWLRILSILGVLFYHAAMPFASHENWHLKNAQTSSLFEEITYFMHLVRMQLLFFISGTVSFYMMKNRTAGSFIALRVRRLLLPLAFGMLVIVPPQVYLERVSQGYRGGFWQFYHTVFNFAPYPKGNFSWHHLWFIAYLFLYDLLLAPLFAWLMRLRSNGRLQPLAHLAKGKWIYLLMLPSLLWYAWLSHAYPATNDVVHDGCYFVYWMLFLLAGFLCVVQPALLNSLQRNRRFSFMLAFGSTLLLNTLRWNHWQPWDHTTVWPHGFSTFALLALRPLVSWAWVFTAIGYGRQYLNKPLPVLPYLNQAVYPFYILHQTVIVVLAWYVLPLADGIFSKYLFIVAVSFFVTVCTYHVFIRPFAITRLLFGMKPGNKPAKPQQQRIAATEPVLV